MELYCYYNLGYDITITATTSTGTTTAVIEDFKSIFEMRAATNTSYREDDGDDKPTAYIQYFVVRRTESSILPIISVAFFLWAVSSQCVLGKGSSWNFSKRGFSDTHKNTVSP